MKGNSKGETRGGRRHKNNNKRVVKNIEEKNVGTKGKRPKQDLTSAKSLTIELYEGGDSTNHRLDALRVRLQSYFQFRFAECLDLTVIFIIQPSYFRAIITDHLR